MAKYDVTPILSLKKTLRGEREWADNERENWDRIDQFAQVILSNPPAAGTPQPIFNNEYKNFNVIGVLDPSSIEFIYNSNGDILETVEHYSGEYILTRRSQYVYYEDTGLLWECTSLFNGIRTITTFLYDGNGNTRSVSTVEEVVE